MRGCELKTRLDHWLRGLFPAAARRGPITLDEALPWLLPKVRPRFEFEARALRAGGPGPEFRPLAGPFALSLVVDLPDQELPVGARELQLWRADFDGLLQQARSNLLARGGEEGFQALGPGRYRSSWQDNLDGSRMLLPGVLQRLRLAGDPVVVLPNPDTLLVVGSEDAEALRWALEGALEFLDEDPRSLNGCPLRLRNYQWQPFCPGAGHPLHPLLARIERRRLQEEYARQKFLLDRRHGVAGQEITVAPFHLERTPAGHTASFTVWPGTVGEAWLPAADRIRLAGEGPAQAWIPWEQVQRRLSHLLEPMGLFPERYRLKAELRAEELHSLLA